MVIETQSFLINTTNISLEATYERRSLHDWRGCDSGCPVAKTY